MSQDWTFGIWVSSVVLAFFIGAVVGFYWCRCGKKESK
jgi:uncharacterized membrane-anchored protein YhcB (DUF1043 family)